MPHHPLTNLDIQKYYQNEPRFNGLYSRDNLPNKRKDGEYVINLDDYSGIGTNWIALYALNNNVTYFDSFWVEHIPKEIKIFIDKSIVVANIFRIEAYDSIMGGYFCIGFIDFMLAGKTLADFTNVFQPNNFKDHGEIILKYFMNNVWKMVECNSDETHNIYLNLNDQLQFRPNKINKIKDYFVPEIKEKELRSKRLPIYGLKVNNRNTRTRCEICSKLTKKTPERHHCRWSGVFIINFENISHLAVLFLLLALNK